MGERFPYTEATRLLLQRTFQDIHPGVQLTADTINFFNDVLAADSEFRPLSLYTLGAIDSLSPLPNDRKHIQIIPTNVSSDTPDIVSHYICAYYDGKVIHIYDSLNSRTLSPIQVRFLEKLFPGKQVVFEDVQQQPNNTDCGFFAIAFAVSLAHERNPCDERYNSLKFAEHLLHILNTQHISPFPLFSNNIASGSDCSTNILNNKGNFSSLVIPTTKNDLSNQKPCSLEKSIKRGRRKELLSTSQEQHRDAVRRYTQRNPEVHREAVRQYSQEHREVHRDAVRRFEKSHPETKRSRHLPANLRKNGLIAAFSGVQLNTILPYYLKTNSLLGSDCFKCSSCRAPLFEEERGRKKWCCGQGAYNILDLPRLDHEIYLHPDFRSRPRMYNEIFAFSALIIPCGWQHPKNGISFIKILGKLYHCVYDLSYSGPYNNPCSFYIDDGEARNNWAKQENLNSAVVKSFSDFLHANNPYIHLFKQLQNEPSEDAHLVFENTTRRTHGPNLGDRRMGYEVAAILSTDKETYYPRKIAIWKIGEGKPHSVDIFHPLYEPFQYPLLYPHGTPGWHIGRLDNNGKKLSQLNYVRCLLLSDSRFRQFDRLSETWLIDMYARIEEERLRYLNFSQRKSSKSALRTALFDEVQSVVSDVRHVNRTNHTEGAQTERAVPTHEHRQVTNDIQYDETVQGEGGVVPGRVYLPSTFTGGQRYMKVKYLNAIALVNRLGGPTYFLTITTNAQWTEIRKCKRSGSKNQPDICARVFHCKLLELLRDLRSGSFFGEVAYIIYVIEFQKRGLPHAHICFRISKQELIPVQAADIDQFIRADIPDIDEAGGKLRELVVSNMIHGPCGPHHRTNLPCWDGTLHKCIKFFPKPSSDATYIDSNGFVNYKRNADNKAHITYRGRAVEIDDTWVVPYNAALLLKYQCHINLELASQRGVVKYLFKYITKGSPLANVAVVSDSDLVNEVEEYVTKRYIGSSDAVWRILEFNLTESEPSVTCLPVHLEGKHSVYFRPGEESQAIHRSSSHLILYFSRPELPELENLTYIEFYEKYILHTTRPKSLSVAVIDHPDGRHFITRRQRGKCVARMFWVAPQRGEQFYLRLLLNIFPCRGYRDLISRGGVHCTSLQQAARNLGLVNDEQEYRLTFAEASEFMLGKALRSFFVLLCNIGAPAVLLWEEFKNTLADDFLHVVPGDPEKASKLALLEIDRFLRRHGSNLLEQGLPVVEDTTTELGRERFQYSSGPLQCFVDEWLPKLSEEQIHLLRYLESISISNNFRTTEMLFLDGPGGYGKTLILKVTIALFRSRGKVVICVASSGIAALNFDGGTTAHSMFRLPLDVGDGSGYWSLTNGSQRAELIREAALIIFDEVSMANRFHLEILDRSLRDMMKNDKPFGGKLIIFSGDFRQCAPVVTDAKTPSDVIKFSLKSSRLWGEMKKFKLTKPQRTEGEECYSKFILKIGNNEIEQVTFGVGKEQQMLIPLTDVPFTNSLRDLLQFVYPENVLSNPDKASKRAVLCTINANVYQINSTILQTLAGDFFNLYSVDWIEENVEDSAHNHVDQDTLHQAQAKGVPPHDLVLKVEAVCILTRNLNFSDNLVNGTKLIVVSISPRLIVVRRPGVNERLGIPRIIFRFPLYRTINMCRRQFPLQVSYAMSIHKSQGQTIDFVGVDLRTDVFSHGQLYVALSRVRSPAHIRVLVPPDRILHGVAYVKNVVYRELL